MIDHVSIAVRDLAASIEFYTAALAPLGIRQIMAHKDEQGLSRHVGFGSTPKPFFWLAKGDPVQGQIHIAIAARDRAEVDAFYTAALTAGGRDNGAPGLRPHYHPGYYGAFILDPDGCNIEVVHHTFS